MYKGETACDEDCDVQMNGCDDFIERKRGGGRVGGRVMT